jgi:cardiolipin synthase
MTNPQRTLGRYFDPTIPSAEVKPTQISKVGYGMVSADTQVNTALQLMLMGLTLVHPMLPFSTTLALTGLQ